MNLNALFAGSIPADHRKYMRVLCKEMLAKGYTKIIIPCVGQFEAVKVAIEAGYEAKNIRCCDSSLFAGILGHVYSGKPIEYLDFRLAKQEDRDYYDKLKTEEDKAAFVLLLIKTAQLREFVYYERAFIEELAMNRDKYVQQLSQLLTAYKNNYAGINYEHADMRDYFIEAQGENEWMVMNPPAYLSSYQKMFKFEKFIEYNNNIADFNGRTEWMKYYELSKSMPRPVLWLANKAKPELPAEDVIYAKEYGPENHSYWLFTQPELLEGFEGRYLLIPKSKATDAVAHYELLDSEHVLSKKDVIAMEPINKETALYYRDLFAHRLGSTVAELYFGIFLNGKLMSVCGFNTSFLRRLQETYIFENFCFSVAHNQYENLNRLSMMCLCSGDMWNYLMKNTLRNSSYVELKSFRTTCLTKYRKSKLNNNLLTLLSSERQENGTYKLMYEQAFYKERTFGDCLNLYIDKDIRIKKHNNPETE